MTPGRPGFRLMSQRRATKVFEFQIDGNMVACHVFEIVIVECVYILGIWDDSWNLKVRKLASDVCFDQTGVIGGRRLEPWQPFGRCYRWWCGSRLRWMKIMLRCCHEALAFVFWTSNLLGGSWWLAHPHKISEVIWSCFWPTAMLTVRRPWLNTIGWGVLPVAGSGRSIRGSTSRQAIFKGKTFWRPLGTENQRKPPLWTLNMLVYGFSMF